MSALIRTSLEEEGFLLAVPTGTSRRDASPPSATEAPARQMLMGDAPDKAGVPPVAVAQEPVVISREEMAKAEAGMLQALRQDAEAKGHAEGLAHGEQTGLAKYRDAVQRLDAVVRAFERAQARELDALEHVLGAVVFEAVCRIAGDALTTEEGCRALVAGIVEREKASGILAIRVSAEDVARLSDVAPDDDSHPVFRNIPLVADESVEAGGCVLSLRHGEIDARIDGQLQMFAQRMKEFVRGAPVK